MFPHNIGCWSVRGRVIGAPTGGRSSSRRLSALSSGRQDEQRPRGSHEDIHVLKLLGTCGTGSTTGSNGLMTAYAVRIYPHVLQRNEREPPLEVERCIRSRGRRNVYMFPHLEMNGVLGADQTYQHQSMLASHGLMTSAANQIVRPRTSPGRHPTAHSPC